MILEPGKADVPGHLCFMRGFHRTLIRILLFVSPWLDKQSQQKGGMKDVFCSLRTHALRLIDEESGSLTRLTYLFYIIGYF